MARIRSIKPEFFTSGTLAECSTNARLLFVGTWVFSDDKGRHKLDYRQLKIEIFPADPFTIGDIEAMFCELWSVGLVSVYDDNGTWYFVVNGWHHQKIDKPQPPKFPDPAACRFVDYSSNGTRTVDEQSENCRRPFVPDTIRSDGIGLDGIGNDAITPPSPQGGTADVNTSGTPNGSSGRKPRKPQYEVEHQSYPPSLDTEDFRAVWQLWTLHRIEIHKPMTPLAASEALAKCEAWGRDRAIAAIRHSVANGWQGLFEPDVRQNGRSAKFVQPGANYDPHATTETTGDPTYGSMK